MSTNPTFLGIDVARPRLSWNNSTAIENWQQLAFEIEAYNDWLLLLAQSDRVDSGESVLVPRPFVPLQSRERVARQLR